MLERKNSNIPALQLGVFSPNGSPSSSAREVDQFKRLFSDIGEIDKTLLMNLTDKELFNECLNNERINLLCQDESFWEKRFRHYFGDKASKDKPATRKWKNHYMKVSMDLDRFLLDPFSFFDIIEWNVLSPLSEMKFCSRPHNQCEPGTTLSLSASPEWVVNNYNLLNLGTHIVLRFGSVTEKVNNEFQNQEYVTPLGTHFTPATLLPRIHEYFVSTNSSKFKNKILHFKGLDKYPDYVEVLIVEE